MKKIIIFGNKQITINCLKLLKKNPNANLIAVVGCETSEDLKIGNPSVREYCLNNNIQYYHPEKLDASFLSIIKNLKPDICFSLFYRDLFSKELLSLAKDGFINIHPSLLPKYRGPVPYLWTLLNNEKITGVTMHYIDERVDSGDVISQIKYNIPNQITGFKLGSKLMDLGFKMFKQQLPLILKNVNKRKKQNENQATYYGKYHPGLRKINWYHSSDTIIRQIQAFTKPFSGAISVVNNKEIIIWNAKIKKISNQILQGPGRIIKLQNNKFIVSTVDGFIEVEDFEILNHAINSLKIGERFDLYI